MQIVNSRQAYLHLSPLMLSDVEEFWAVALRADKSIIETKCIFRGTVDACLVHPRDIFRFACVHNASCLLVAHNHPSNVPLPSPADRRLTWQLLRASEIIQIPIIDHLIITQSSYKSFADEGWLREGLATATRS